MCWIAVSMTYPRGRLFGPAGGNLDAIDGIDEHTKSGMSAVGNGVGFQELGERVCN